MLLATKLFAVLLFLSFSVTNAYANGAFVTVSTPRLLDSDGNRLESARVGQTVIVSTAVVNTTLESTPFVVIIEARDKQGVTVYLQFAMGTIHSMHRSQIGQSWSPELEGEYLLRTFAFTSFSNFVPLTTISESEVTITPYLGRPNFDVIIEGQ